MKGILIVPPNFTDPYTINSKYLNSLFWRSGSQADHEEGWSVIGCYTGKLILHSCLTIHLGTEIVLYQFEVQEVHRLLIAMASHVAEHNL